MRLPAPPVQVDLTLCSMQPSKTEAALDAVYRDRLLELFRAPLREGEAVPGASRGQARNRTCGDAVSFSARTEGGRLADCRQRTDGCAISTAAASLLAENLSGLDPSEARTLLDAVRETVFRGAPAPTHGELGMLAAVHGLPSRHECVGVALEAAGRCIDELGRKG